MILVRFYDPTFTPASKLTYSVITAMYKGKWIFVRHRKRETWEIPGGHIEMNESADAAADRELREESGAVEFKLECVATYSVEQDGITGYGRLFLAEVTQLGAVTDTSEIAEITFLESLPENLTYPDIQPRLFKKVLEYVRDGDICI
ncbi:MAG: NUDIX domain-containing protein [Bacteroidota bacterium]|nr:NUDIX domain-containing protein [Bacteroidota bacterium]